VTKWAFHVDAGSGKSFRFDNFNLEASDPETTVFAYNDANELTTQTADGTATNFSYDAWGRLISKWQGDGLTTYADYEWRYGSYLKRVDTTFPGEETVAYQVDSLGKRRLKALEPDSYDPDNWTWYRWSGMSVVSEYAGATGSSTIIGTRERSYVGGLAQVEGANPSTGTYQYMTHDHLGSVRGLYDGSKGALGAYDYLPYGTPQTVSGLPLNKGFTGHQWDPELNQYFAPYRYYNPGMSRWLKHEPLGLLTVRICMGMLGGIRSYTRIQAVLGRRTSLSGAGNDGMISGM
jgi:RHS repeat-associated protein